ncbi:hypothetical protein HDU96_000240 [Phlyctochytrium bullatum]|nr:hypothetical protein HDU96_000240 [Phlyctochytrium bullatum]
MDSNRKRGQRPIHEHPNPDPDPEDGDDDESGEDIKVSDETKKNLTYELVQFSKSFLRPEIAEKTLARLGAKPKLKYDDKEGTTTIQMSFGLLYYLRVWLFNEAIPYYSMFGGETLQDIAQAWLSEFTENDHMEHMDSEEPSQKKSMGEQMKEWFQNKFPKLYRFLRIAVGTGKEMLTEMAERFGVDTNPWSKNLCDNFSASKKSSVTTIGTDIDYAGFGQSLVTGDFDGDGIADLGKQIIMIKGLNRF